jgi:hypothetical protein
MNRLLWGLSILPLFSLVACVQVKTSSCGSGNCDASPPPQVSVPSEKKSVQLYGRAERFSNGTSAPLCQLSPPITSSQMQANSAWCWATSTTVIINHLEPRRPLKECQTVHTTLSPEIDAYEKEVLETTGEKVKVECCRVTDDALKTENPDDKDIIASKTVCHTTFRPEWALMALGYENRFKLVRWDSNSTIPQGLPWEELTGQICSNRPFISVKLWDEGGTHTEVVTGYHINPDAWVDVDTHGIDGFYSIPFDDYLGKPGDYVHVRDYYDIGL